MGIAQRFVTIGTRQVHYRRAGEGPVLLMLHASLNSSATFIPLIGPLSDRFTVIAMDTPGYGLSDVLSADPPSIEDYADGVIEFMDALGLRRVTLYGMLTGTMIGVDLAARYPERFAGVVLNTMLVHTEGELDSFIEKFTPDMPLRADGTHLVQTWDLMRRNAIAYPWFEPGPTTRFNLPLPEPAELHLRLMNCLSAGEHYAWGARAAFSFLKRTKLESIRAPTVFMGDAAQPFGPHLERLSPLPAGASITRFDDWARLPETISRVVEQLPAADAAPAPPDPQPIANRCSSDLLDFEGVQVHVRRCGEGQGRPVLLLHGAGGEASLMEARARSLVGKRPLIAFDGLGHGASSPWVDSGAPFLVDQTAALGRMLDVLGAGPVDIYAPECGAALAVSLAASRPTDINAIHWHEVLHPAEAQLPLFQDRYAPIIEPDHSGAYLMQAWSFLRDQDIYSPWFDKGTGGIVWDTPAQDSRRLHLRAVALLKSLAVLKHDYAMGFDPSWRNLLKELQVPLVIHTHPRDPRSADARVAAEMLGQEPNLLGDDPSAWVEQALR